MATITSAQDGNWIDAGTWYGGTVPTAEDSVVIAHKITLTSSATAKNVQISKYGSLVVSTGNLTSIKTFTTESIELSRGLDDDRVIRLDGMNLAITKSSITASGGGDGFPTTNPSVISTEGGIIIDDPGLYGFTAQMQDIKPEGCARAYARKVSNGVRYLNVVVHIRNDLGNIIGELYRMAENPFQVLAVTNSVVIKGYIEAITPVDSVGKEYRSFRISIAEGL